MTELITLDELKQPAARLKLYGLLAHWEETEGKKRGLVRRLGQAHLGRFKPLSDVDWDWLERGDKDTVADMMPLDFIAEATHIIVMGPNGVGKSTIAQNMAYHAVLQGHTALLGTK